MYPLFGFELFEITPIGLLALVGWAIAAVCLGKLFYRDDRALRELQSDVDDLATELAKIGFTLLPPLLKDLAFLDVVKMRRDIKYTIDTLRDPAKRRADFAKLLDGLLNDEVKNTDTRQSFLDGVVTKFKAAGVNPTGAAGTDAIGNAVTTAIDRSVFQTPSAPVIVNFHGVSAPASDFASAPAPAPAAAK